MSTATRNVLDAALALPPADRALIADALLESLQPTNPEIDRAWLREVLDRIATYEAGEMEALSEEGFFAEGND